MKKLLAKLAFLGVVAGGVIGYGASDAAAAGCARGSTDCPMYTQPDSGVARRHWRPDRNPDRHWDRNDHWRRHDRSRHWRGPRYRYGGGPSIRFYYEQPRYRYVEPAPVYRYRADVLPRAHIDWCRRHYRTYRLSDNSFKPTLYTRRECVSPFWP